MSDGLPVDPLALCEEVKARYRVVAIDPHGSYHFHTSRSLARLLGYEEAAGAALTDAAVEAFAGVGNPFSLGILRPGERVVDLGSGGGFDCFIAAAQVKPEGIGTQGRCSSGNTCRVGCSSAARSNAPT
jgi:arsenite methyltransferase